MEILNQVAKELETQDKVTFIVKNNHEYEGKAGQLDLVFALSHANKKYCLGVRVQVSEGNSEHTFPFSNGSFDLFKVARKSQKARLQAVEQITQNLPQIAEVVKKTLEKNKENFGEYDYSHLTN